MSNCVDGGGGGVKGGGEEGGGVSGTRIIRQLRDACDTCVAFDDVKLLEFFVGALHLIVGL